MSARFVIVGASLTGASAAAELREAGFEGEIVLIGEDPRPPYERPPLTKGFLRGESQAEEAQVHPPAFYAENRIELRTGTRVEAIDRDGSEVELAGGERVAYDKLLLATGALPITLDVPGAELDGVVTLRTVDDVEEIRRRVSSGRRVAVIGGGWIGMEAAASFSQLDAQVTVVEAGPAPLARVVGEKLGGFFAELHREHGVDVLTNAALESFEGDGALKAAVLADGRRIECEMALVGVGVRPAVALAEKAGLTVSNGIEVDAGLRTSDPKIFAAGDVALAEHPRYGRLRVEHWENARRQGRAAARAMVGEDVTYDAIPYFFSDQYDLGLEYSGHADAESDELVVRGDLAAREFVAYWTRDGRVTAGMNVNVWDVSEQIQELIASGGDVPEEGKSG